MHHHEHRHHSPMDFGPAGDRGWEQFRGFGRGSDRGFGRGFDRGFGRGFDRGFGGHGRGHGRGRRVNTRAAVLGLLAERPMHGYEMISELEQRTGGAWRPSPGSIYPTLQLLEDEGLIVSEETGGRKRFTLTDTGREEAATAGQPWQDFDQTRIVEMQQFREAGFGIMQALQQVSSAGTADQRREALEIMNETKRKLYAILAS